MTVDTDDQPSADLIDFESEADDFAAQVTTALRALIGLDRPSTSSDRRDLWRRHNLPSHISSFLGRAHAIEPPPGETDDSRTKVRVVTEKGREWIRDPTLILRAAEDASGYIAAINAALAQFAREERLPVEDEREYILRSKKLWPKNLWPSLGSHLDRFRTADSDLHRWVHHLRSSQAFAFNLFGPLAVGWPWARDTWRPVFGDVRRVEFEYPADRDPAGDDPLQERTPDRPHRTRVDVRVDHGAHETTLVEVKLTEQEFGGCSKAHDAGNPLRATCTTPDLALEEIANGCYLAQIAGRPYFRRLMEPASLISASRLQAFSYDGCPLRGGLYQIARNLMMAQHVRTSGAAVRFAVVAPSADLNPALHGHRSLRGYPDVLSFLRAVVHEKDQDAIRIVDFAEVVAHARSLNPEADSWVDYMRRKYIEPLRRGAAARKSQLGSSRS